MKKIILLMTMLFMMGCSPIERYKDSDENILKEKDTDGVVKVIFTGSTRRAFLEGGTIILMNKEYYLLPDDYTITWNSIGYMGVEIGSGRHSNHRNIDGLASSHIKLEEDSIVKLNIYNVSISKMGGE